MRALSQQRYGIKKTIVFNLVNDIDVQKTQERIEKFRQENKEIIQKNQARRVIPPGKICTFQS
jgi:hypothetical protein